MKDLRTAAAIQGEKKRKLDMLGRKKRAAQRELEQIAQAKRRAAGKEELNKDALKTPDTGRGKTPGFTALVHRVALGTHAERHRNVPYDQNFAYNPVEHKTKNGILRGAEFEPIGEPNGKVVLFFSGSGGTSAQYVQPVLEPYLLMGAKVVTMDYRGFGKSETLDKSGRKTGTPLSDKTMYEDGKDMLEYVTKTMGVKPENVILHGYSMGGPVASKVAADFAQERERIALAEGRKVKPMKLGGVVLHSPTNSMYEVAKDTSNRVMAFGGWAFGGWAFGGGFNTVSHMQRLHKYDPEMPVHYVSGNYDAEPGQRPRSARLPGDLQEKLNDAYEEGITHRANRQKKMTEEELRLEEKALEDVAEYVQNEDKFDGLDIDHTKIHQDPKAQFVNATTYRGTGAHMAENLSYNDEGLRRLMETNRSAEPELQREQEPQLQGP